MTTRLRFPRQAAPATVADPMVGRDDERAALRQALVTLAEPDGRAGFVAVTGDPGIGKSRLLADVREQSQLAGLQVAEGRVGQLEGALPFGVFVEALDDLLTALSPEELGALDDLDTGLLARAFPGLAGKGVAPSAPFLETERYRLHRAVRRLIEHLAGPCGLVIALDDLHWCDDASVEFLDYLLRHPPRAAVLVVLAFRPRQAHPSLTAALGRAPAESVLSMSLPPLGLDDAVRLLGSEIDHDRKVELFRASGGNPFYLEALARSGTVPVGVGGGPAGGELPAMVESALQSELARVSEPGRQLAHAAAIVGDPFDAEMVAECAGVSVVEALGQLDLLLQHDLVRPTPTPRRFQFRHPLVRHVVYRCSGEAFRVEAHGRAAAALQRRGASAAMRAHHVERSAGAGDEQAIEVLVEAAHDSLSGAPASAAHWLGVALDLLPSGAASVPRRLELSFMRARALAVSGDLLASRELLDDVLGRLPDEPTPVRVRTVSLCAMVDRLLGRARASRAMLTRELRLLGERDEPDVARLELDLAAAELMCGELEASRERTQRALAVARDHRSAGLEALATGVLAAIHTRTDEIDDALRWLTTSTTLIDGMYDSELSAHLDALYWAGWSAAFLDRFEACLRITERTAALAKSSGLPYSDVYRHGARAAALQWLGRLDEAAVAAQTAVDVAMLSDSAEMRCFALGQQAWTAFLRGETEVALRVGEHAVREGEGIEGPTAVNRVYRHAIVRLAAGLDHDVSVLVRAGGGPTAPHLDGFNKAIFYEALTAAEVARGRVAAAGEWAARAEATVHPSLPARSGFALLARARVELAGGVAEAAAHTAAQAADHFAKAGDRYDTGRAHLVAGRAWTRAGDATKATHQLGRAVELFATYGARALHREAQRDLRRIGARTPENGRSQGRTLSRELTRREVEVANLLARGLRNRDIAAQLYLSRRTVETHVSRILAKLGVPTRAAVASVWTQRHPS